MPQIYTICCFLLFFFLPGINNKCEFVIFENIYIYIYLALHNPFSCTDRKKGFANCIILMRWFIMSCLIRIYTICLTVIFCDFTVCHFVFDICSCIIPYPLSHNSGGVLWFHVGRPCVCLSIRPSVVHPSIHPFFISG